MKELLWIFPILLAIALVLGACRGETLARILREGGKSFLRLTAGMLALCVALEVLLLVIPRLL